MNTMNMGKEKGCTSEMSFTAAKTNERKTIYKLSRKQDRIGYIFRNICCLPLILSIIYM